MVLDGNHSTTERLHLTSPVVKDLQHPLLYSVIFVEMQGKKVVSSTVILEMQAAWNLPSSTASTVTVAYRMARNFRGLKFSQISLD